MTAPALRPRLSLPFLKVSSSSMTVSGRTTFPPAKVKSDSGSWMRTFVSRTNVLAMEGGKETTGKSWGGRRCHRRRYRIKRRPAGMDEAGLAGNEFEGLLDSDGG